MKGSSDSASSSKLTWIFIMQIKKFYWNADSTTNSSEWKVDVVQESWCSTTHENVFRVFGKIWKNWLDRWISHDHRSCVPRTGWWTLKRDCLISGWYNMKVCSFLLLNFTESFEKGVMEKSNADWKKAKTDNDKLELFIRLCSSHSFCCKQTSPVEQRAIRLKHDTHHLD